MANGANFVKDYFLGSDIDINEALPGLFTDFRGKLCLRGKKIEYEDFTKMVKRGNSYVPLVCCNQVKEDERVLDLWPVLNVGVAELITVVSTKDDLWYLHFLELLGNGIDVEDWRQVYETVAQWAKHDYLDSTEIALLENMRSSLIDYRFPIVRRIFVSMCALRIANPKFYCMALIEALKLVLFDVPMRTEVDNFKTDKRNPGTYYVPNNLIVDVKEPSEWIVQIMDKSAKFHTIDYYSEEEKKIRRISNCRDIGWCLLSLFAIHLFRNFGESVGHGVRTNYLQDKVEEKYVACLGDDYVGRYLRNGRCTILDSSNDASKVCLASGTSLADCSKDVVRNGLTVGRGFDEAHILWKYATGIKEIDNAGILPPVDVGYGTSLDVIHYCCTALMKHLPKIVDEVDKEAYKKAVKSLDTEKLLAPYRREMEKKCQDRVAVISAELQSATKEVEQLRGRLEVAQRDCDNKRETIQQLREELAILKAQVRNTYMDIDDEESIVNVESTSEQEMLDFVNQFRLVVVGGFDTMKPRMEQLGFTNVSFITSETAYNNTVASADFVCICSKFCTHGMVYGIEKQFPNKLKQFFYFNGTNANSLLNAYYNFVKNWFDSEEVQ